MKFTVRTSDLKTALAKAKLTVSVNDTNALLQNFALRAEDGKLTVIATDLQLATVSAIEATVDEPGTTTLPGMKLHSLATASSADTMVFESSDNDSVLVSSGAFSASLLSLPFEDYPKLDDFSEEASLTTARGPFLENLQRISFSVNDNEAKKNLLAVKIDKGLMQATDGTVTAAIQFDSSLSDVIIPSLAVRDLCRVLRASLATDVKLCSTGAFLLFKVGDDLFMTRLAALKFPNVPKRIIEPTDKNDIILTADKAKLEAAVKRVGVTANDKNFAMVFELAQTGGATVLRLSSSDAAGNSSAEELEVDYSGAPTKLYFNYTRILDILGALNKEKALIKMHSNKRVPVRFEEDDPKFLCFVMRLAEQVVASVPKPEGANAEDADTI